MGKAGLFNQKTVFEEKIDESNKINQTMSNETKLSKSIDVHTEKLFKANDTDTRLEEAQKIMKNLEVKKEEEIKAKEAANKLIIVVKQEKERTQKKIEWREREKKRMAWARGNLTAAHMAYNRSKETLQKLKFKLNTTVAAWPDWIGSRYQFLQGRKPGSCVYPAQCQQKVFVDRDENLKPLFRKAKDWQKAATKKREDCDNGKGSDFKGTLPPGWMATYPQGSSDPQGGLLSGTKQSATWTIPGGQFLVGADFCPLESEADPEQKVNIMMNCERDGYMREKRCCVASSMEFDVASQDPTICKTDPKTRGCPGTSKNPLSPFQLRAEIDTFKDY